jgi:prepilin-type N-terminal cleavage/methylation domain-containing protein
MKRIAGFTFIEIMVVIAVIGIAAAISYGFLNGAQARGTEAKLKGDLANIVKQAEVDRTTTNNMNIVCGINGYTQSPDMAELFASAAASARQPVLCNSNATQFVVAVALASGYWCADASGAKKLINNPITTELTCP